MARTQTHYSKFFAERGKKRVEEAIKSVPHAIGMNNHMGSRAVEDEDIVRAIVEVAKGKEVIYYR